MARFAYIIDGKIDSVYDELPTNWQNISNFYALENDEAYLKSLGWYKVNKIIPTIDPASQYYGEVIRWIGDDGLVYETEEVIDSPIVNVDPQPVITPADIEWTMVRSERDRRMSEMDWRILRYNREVRLGLTPTEDIMVLDQYMQALADITLQSDPFNIIWPTIEQFMNQE